MLIISAFEKYTVEDQEYCKSRRQLAASATHPQRLEQWEKDHQKAAMGKVLQTVEEEPGQRSLRSKDINKLEKMKTEITRQFCQKAFRLSPRAT